MSWIRRHPALAFFLGTMGFSWACWVPFAAARIGLLPIAVPAEVVWLGEFGPSIVGLTLTALLTGRRGLRERLRALCNWRVRPGFFLLAVAFTPVVAVASMAIDAALAGSVYDWQALGGWNQRFIDRTSAFEPSLGLIDAIVEFLRLGPVAAALGMVALAITNGGLSEEIGWRGWAQSSLRSAGSSPLVTSLLVGLMWAAWHTPTPVWEAVLSRPWPEGLGSMATIVLQYTLLTVPLAVVYTVLVEGSAGSLLLAVLLHASYNLTITLTTSAWPGFPMGTMVIVIWVLAIGLALGLRLWRSSPEPPVRADSSPACRAAAGEPR